MRFFGPPGARPRIGTLVSAAIACAVLLVLPSSSAIAADQPPDLVATPPTNPQFEVKQLDDGQNHFLVRFDAVLRNIGPGPLEVRGSNPVNGVMTVSSQRVYNDGTGFRDDFSRHPVIKFESADGHNHWHVQNAARYALWNEAGTTEVGRGAKVGFCLEDVAQFIPGTPGHSYDNGDTNYCNANMPNAPSVFEGITYGWQDVYVASLAFQWVDLSDIAPGRYRLGEQVDPDNLFVEYDKSNNGPALSPDIVTVPGWFPSSATVTAKQAQTIALGAQRYGNSASAAFKIESAPKHGKLNVPAGAALPGFQVVYTPNPGFEGSDTFNFSVRDPASAYPVHSPVATVTVKVPGAPVHSLARLRLLTKPHFTRRGRYLFLRARAKKTGMLNIQIAKARRLLGSCAKQARAKRGFRCRIKLLKHASPARAKATATLLVSGNPIAAESFRLPRRIGRK
jgi:Lysyl oxidase/Bacterial Ig domain